MGFADIFSTVPDRRIGTLQNLATLITLRWFAVAGVGTALAISYYIRVPMDYRIHLLLLSVLATVNFAYVIWWKKLSVPSLVMEDHEKEPLKIPASIFTFLFSQIAVDWVLLILFLHFAGGILNPFVYVFVLHMIIGVALPEFNMTNALTAFGLSLIGCITCLEYNGILEYHKLWTNAPSITEYPMYMVLGKILALGLVLFVSGHITYQFVSGKRERERKMYRMSMDLIALSNVKSDFLYRVTHELKAPVAAMMSAVDAVFALAADKLSSRSKNMLQKIRKRGEGLLDLIRDLLAVAKLSSPAYEVELQPTNAAPLLEVITEMVEFKAAEMGVAFEVNISEYPLILAEEIALKEIFSNLISNAVRYTPAEGKVTVELMTDSESGSLLFQVSDTGIGINEKDMENLFSEFFRATNAKMFTPAGTGLGLSITKAHVDRFGGTIVCESKLNEGTTFTVRIPAYIEKDDIEQPTASNL